MRERDERGVCGVRARVCDERACVGERVRVQSGLFRPERQDRKQILVLGRCQGERVGAWASGRERDNFSCVCECVS